MAETTATALVPPRKRDTPQEDHGAHRKKTKKKSRQQEEDDANEERLTALVFGGQRSGLGSNNNSRFAAQAHNDGEDDEEGDDGGVLFEIDRTGTGTAEDWEEDDDDDNNNNNTNHPRKRVSKAQALAVGRNNNGKTLTLGGPVWVDQEDARVHVNLLETNRLRKLRTSREEAAASALNGVELERRMRERYQTTMGRTARTDWAELEHPNDDDDNENDDVQDRVQGSSVPLLRQSGKRRLEPNSLDLVRCPDANLTDPSSAVIRSVEFHPSSDPDRPLLFTAGLDKTLRFFQVQGGSEEEGGGSRKIHGIHFPNFPIYSAAFLGSTGNVVCSSRRKHFYVYHSEAGKLDHIPNIVGREEKSLEVCCASPDGRTVAFAGNDGFVILYDTTSRQWIADLKLNGSVRSLAFSPNDNGSGNTHIWASGSDGDVYRWDMKSRKCVERFSNQDGTSCSALAVSNQHLAVGAQSGVVNLYENGKDGSRQQQQQRRQQDDDEQSQRTPIRSILNLQTSIHACRFNGDGQILAMGTHREQRGFRLVHVPTATVFANWPASTTPLGYVWSMDFSPGSQFLAVGNDKGKCLLYQLKHYSQ